LGFTKTTCACIQGNILCFTKTTCACIQGNILWLYQNNMCLYPG
jgi:hypothetical protein